MTSSLMSGIFSKIDPDVVGSDRRDVDVAQEYGYRLVDVSENATRSTVRHLVNHYPSHDFIIDDEEARELFENVSYPKIELMTLAGFLGKMAYNEASDVLVMSMSELEETDGEDGDKSESEGDGEVAAGAPSEGPHPTKSGGDDRPGDTGSEPRKDGPQESPDDAQGSPGGQ